MRPSYGYWFLGLALLWGAGTPFADSAFSQVRSTPIEPNAGGIGAAGAVNTGISTTNTNLNLNTNIGLTPNLALPGAPNVDTGNNSGSGGGEQASWTADELASWLESSRSSELMHLPIMEKVHRVIVP